MVHLLLAIIYLSFISLGLPDSLLGSAWPAMYSEMDVPVSYAGIISMIISVGTIISSLMSDRLTKKLGTGAVTAISVAMTAAALFGFSVSDSFLMLTLWAVPYGLGAGSVDAALNNYVALHYASRHMSWLHCMWGVGTIVGPYIMGYALTNGISWNYGYRIVSVIQVVLAVILFISLPIWNKKKPFTESEKDGIEQVRPLTLRQVIKIPGAKQVMITFFCYCALEATAMLWSGSYMVLNNNISAEKAAGYAGMFFIGITAGRAINGFLTFRFSDTAMIRIGQAVIAIGIIMMLLPLGNYVTLAGLIVMGIGCAPVYPCIIHSTPERFGPDKSQALIGVQMASAYTGTCLMPPLFGLIANHIDVALFPVFLLMLLGIMIFMHEIMIRKTKK